MRPMHLIVGSAMLAASATTVSAANLTDLDPGNTKFDQTGANTSGVADIDRPSGLTYNVTVTPTAADLTGTVQLIEVGGTTNGTGLYLFDGVPTFISKQNSSNFTNPEDGLGDHTFGNADSVIAVQADSALTADTAYSIASIMRFGTNGDDLPITTAVDFAVQADGESIQSTHRDIDYTAGEYNGVNWNGNNTVSYGTLDGNAGFRGGLSGEDSFSGPHDSGIYDADTVQAFSGTLGEGLFWNDQGNVVVPEPSSLLLIGAGSLLAGGMRRRRRA